MLQYVSRFTAMARRKRRAARMLALFGAITIFAMATATAAFKLRVSVNGGLTFPINVVDNGVGDLNPMLGVIVSSGSAGGFNVVVNTAQSKPVVGSLVNPNLDLNVTVTSAGGIGGPIMIETTDTGFAGGGSMVDIGGGTQPGGGISTVQWDTWADSSNVEFGTGGVHIGFGPTVASPFMFSGSASGVITAPYSMTNRVTINMIANQGTLTGDFNSQVLPEGSSLALLIPGLLPIGTILWRRRRT